MDYTLASPAGDEDWRVFHDIGRKVLFEGRRKDAFYDDKHPDDRARLNPTHQMPGLNT
ncbi:MAG: hypothetical protein Q8L54_01245 [Devosia sp.]|nr:hypothetical protein [Devosia sp.]